jgi:hypothetical protein
MSPATAQSGPRGGYSRFRVYNAYALDTLRIVETFGEYAVKSGDPAKYEKFAGLYDGLVPIGFRAQELLEREAESTIPPRELERQWRELARKCVEFRKSIDPGLVNWASRESAAGVASPDDWDALTANEPEVPDDLLFEIRQQAASEHPGDDSAQQRFVERQTNAYRQWQTYDSIRSAPFDVYQFVREKAAREHPGDYASQNLVLQRQMAAYEQVQQYEVLLEMPAADLLHIKERAAVDYPYDFSTQLFVIRRNVEKYLELKRLGASSDAIVRHILRR